MKKMALLLLFILFITACGNKSVLINEEEYDVNDNINVLITLNNINEENFNVCPVIAITKEGEKNAENIAKYVDFNTENIEFTNINVNNFGEDYKESTLLFYADLSNSADTNLLSDNLIENIKLTIKKEGNYKISFANNSEECYTKYKDNLQLQIIK